MLCRAIVIPCLYSLTNPYQAIPPTCSALWDVKASEDVDLMHSHLLILPSIPIKPIMMQQVPGSKKDQLVPLESITDLPVQLKLKGKMIKV